MTPESPQRDRAGLATDRASRFDSLVGSYFHSTADKGWRGLVVAEPNPSVYLCELFSWIAGDSTHQVLVWLEDMRDWRFYDDAEWMANDYELGLREQWERERAGVRLVQDEQS